MNINDIYAGTLNASHLQGQDRTVTISGGEVKQYEDRKRIALNLAEFPQPLVLNKTNALQIALVLGTAEVTQWKGQQVTLYPTTTQFGGRTVDCIRVRDERPQAQPQATTEQPQKAGPQTYRF